MEHDGAVERLGGTWRKLRNPGLSYKQRAAARSTSEPVLVRYHEVSGRAKSSSAEAKPRRPVQDSASVAKLSERSPS